MDKWKVKTGDAEIHDPWEVSIGDVQDYQEIPDPWQFEMGPIQDYQEYDIDPAMLGEAELLDPDQAGDVFEVANPDLEGAPYRVFIKRGR